MNDELKKKYDAALEKLTPEYAAMWIRDVFTTAVVTVSPNSINIYRHNSGIQSYVDITTEDKLDHAAMANKVHWVCKAFLIAMLNDAIPKE